MANSSFRELCPLCCLDFYVHSSIQRGGHGKWLFDTMLAQEGVPPHRIAYDRPSPKLMGFMRKHFGLSSFTPQENNFVVFHQYFDAEPSTPGRGRRGRQHKTDPASAQPHVELLTVESNAPVNRGGGRGGGSSRRWSDESTGGSSGYHPHSSAVDRSSLEALWADSQSQDTAIKRDRRQRGDYRESRSSTRRTVIDAARHTHENGQRDGQREGQNQRGAGDRTYAGGAGYAVETRHRAVDASAGRRGGAGGQRWQEGRVASSGGHSLASLQALLQPHQEGAQPCHHIAPRS